MLRLLVPCRSWVSSRMTARNLTTSAWKVCCNRFFMWSFIKVSMMITSLLLSAARDVQRFHWTPYFDNRCWWPSISGICQEDVVWESEGWEHSSQSLQVLRSKAKHSIHRRQISCIDVFCQLHRSDSPVLIVSPFFLVDRNRIRFLHRQKHLPKRFLYWRRAWNSQKDRSQSK